MGLLNKKYRLYICFGLIFVLFITSLFVFKPFIKMLELYTLFVRVGSQSLTPVLDFGSENFIVPAAVPRIPNVEFFNYPLIYDLFYCFTGVGLSCLCIYFCSNLFVGFCLGLSAILGCALFSIFRSHTYAVWIPIVWPFLVQIFFFTSFITIKAAAKFQTQISTVKLFGYDINLFPNTIPFAKTIVKQPEKVNATVCCFKIKYNYMNLKETISEEMIYKINDTFKIIIDGCLKYSGIIDKTSNNSICAYWLGENNALNALTAVMEINKMLEHLPFGIKVSCGISTGDAMFGIIGSENFSNYTLIGNVSDVSSRLENACIFHNTSILICGETFKQLEDKLVAIHKGVISLHSTQSQIDFYKPENFVNKMELENK